MTTSFARHSISTPLRIGGMLAAGFCLAVPRVKAVQVRVDGPPGSERFGSVLAVLPNGNIVVSDPSYDAPGPVKDVGAVYLYDGGSLDVISVITGELAGDNVGTSITVLSDGNFVIGSPNWANGPNAKAGAVTWASGETGVSGKVSLANSLAGSKTNDVVGLRSIITLPNGSYVISNPEWDNGMAADAGAVTWVGGRHGVTGPITPENSLVGTHPNDALGMPSGGFIPAITVLENGNYVVRSLFWDNGSVKNAGAVTWGNGTGGTRGAVSAANSLVGSSEDDHVGDKEVVFLSNSDYLILSPSWDREGVANAGAVTWCGGAGGTSGPISSANSLVGARAEDAVGADRAVLRGSITVLSNGNYVVSSPKWDSAAVPDAGAVTWGSAAGGVSGVVSAANSLVGASANDLLGSQEVTALSTGNYVVSCPGWNFGELENVGAATWCDGAVGKTGEVSIANSLTGSQAYDYVGERIIVLTNGNYAALSSGWANGAEKGAGAVTWCDGLAGKTGAVSPLNSLVGQTRGDSVGLGPSSGPDYGRGVTPLHNGNYVVISPNWVLSGEGIVGAVTWCDGLTGRTGGVSVDNSLVGAHHGDHAGSEGVIPLPGGNYVFSVPRWGPSRVGAVSWGNGATGSTGRISEQNSLVGGTWDDQVGAGGVTVLKNGNYVVNSPHWANGPAHRAGAVTWGDGAAGTSGRVSAANSIVGEHVDNYVGRSQALENGNYLVATTNWGTASLNYLGAVAWCDGATGSQGVMSASNSLVGSVAGDELGSGGYYRWHGFSRWNGLISLRNGHYLVNSPEWANYTGAVTWGNGTGGPVGEVSVANSFLGTMALTPTDSAYDIEELEGGLVLIRNDRQGSGALASVGTVTLIDANQPTAGTVGQPNTVVGTLADRGAYMFVHPDTLRSRVIVAHGVANRFTVLSLGNPILRDWRRASFQNATEKVEDLADFDGDDVPNLLEFAFGTPAQSGTQGVSGLKYSGPWSGGGNLDAPGLPVIERRETPGEAEFRALFVRRRDHLQAGLKYTPQFSTGLEEWVNHTNQVSVMARTASHEVVSVPWPIGNSEGPPRFFRVKVDSVGMTQK